MSSDYRHYGFSTFVVIRPGSLVVKTCPILPFTHCHAHCLFSSCLFCVFLYFCVLLCFNLFFFCLFCQFVLKNVTYNLEYTASNIKYILSLRFKVQEQIIRTLDKTWLLRSLRSFHRSRFLVEQLLHTPRKGCPAKKLYRKNKVEATQMKLVRIT